MDSRLDGDGLLVLLLGLAVLLCRHDEENKSDYKGKTMPPGLTPMFVHQTQRVVDPTQQRVVISMRICGVPDGFLQQFLG
jgi:hypothetical protein